MSTATMTAPTNWFSAYEDTVIGQTFVGNRTRLHVADLRVVAPDSLAVRILCGAGDYGAAVDVTTVVRNINLDEASEEDCRAWWQKKVSMEPNQKLDRLLPGGLRRPRICGQCESIREGLSIT